MDKMILDHVIKLDWVYDCFFALESPLEQILESEESNAKAILAPIRTALSLMEMISRLITLRRKHEYWML